MSQEPEDLGFELPPPATASRGRVLVVVLVLVAGAFAFGWSQHKKTRGDTIAAAGDGGAVRVDVMKPKVLDSNEGLVLPGVVRALEEAKIYPRTAGYVKRWLVDIGDKVTEGQLLAEIEAPDVDAQLAQARAQLAQAQAALLQAKAQAEYSKANADRNVTMAQQQLIAKATLEQAVAQAKVDAATVTADEANIASMDANVRRLAEMVSFQKVTAPFAGTITSRTIDRGNLVGDTTTASTATPMFTLVATDPVRVFVDMPQTVAPSVHQGGDAIVTVREFAGKKFPGKVTRAANALDPDLHVMSTEIDVPNHDGTLLPGMYVQAQLTLAVPHRVVEIPSTALYSDSQGIRVATVDAHNKAHFVPIGIERDTGATLWVATGLTGDEKLVKLAVPTLAEGDAVEESK
ncbi:MAG TPA: efflux RND transporter periplasmic adaptor subunit [Kofleriaceae bacterium]|nr:efflux RND transporter periplasmic adaptor subunit [Kofleriaceae bacterium]